MALDRAWFDALVDDDGSNTVGSVWNKTQIDALLDSVDAELGFVRSFFPVEHYGQAGINVDGRYVKFGRLVILQVTIFFPTVTSGNVTWFDGLPVAAHTGIDAGLVQGRGKLHVWQISGASFYAYDPVTGTNAPLSAFSGQQIILSAAYVTV